MAATASDFRSLKAPQHCSGPLGSDTQPMLMIIGAPGSVEEQLVRDIAGAGVPFRAFVTMMPGGRTRSATTTATMARCGQGKAAYFLMREAAELPKDNAA